MSVSIAVNFFLSLASSSVWSSSCWKLKKNPDSSLNDITPPASRSAMILSLLRIPLMPSHTSSFFSGGLLSVGLGDFGSAMVGLGCSVGVGVGLGSAGLGVARLSKAISACFLARRSARNFSIASLAAAFFCAVSIVSVIALGSNSSPSVSALVNLCCPSPDSLNFSLTLFCGVYTYSIPLSVQFLRNSSKLLL